MRKNWESPEEEHDEEMQALVPNNYSFRFEVSDVIDYMITGELPSPEKMKQVERLVSNFRQNINGAMITIVYKQVSRLGRLLDTAERLEARMYDELLTSDTEVMNSIEHLQKMLFILQGSITQTMNGLRDMLFAKSGQKGLVAFDTTFIPASTGLTSPQSIEDAELVTETNRRSREKIRQFVAIVERVVNTPHATTSESDTDGST